MGRREEGQRRTQQHAANRCMCGPLMRICYYAEMYSSQVTQEAHQRTHFHNSQLHRSCTHIMHSHHIKTQQIRYCVAIMADTEGSELHTGELSEAVKVEVGTQGEDFASYEEVFRANSLLQREQCQCLGPPAQPFHHECTPPTTYDPSALQPNTHTHTHSGFALCLCLSHAHSLLHKPEKPAA